MSIESDIADAHRLLEGIGDRLQQSRPLLAELGDELREHAEAAFATGGFGTWAPLSPQRVSEKGSSRILIDTGGLLDSLTGGGSVDIDDESVTLSSDHPGGGFARAGARGAPRRDPLPEPPGGVVDDWADLALGFFVDGRGA